MGLNRSRLAMCCAYLNSLVRCTLWLGPGLCVVRCGFESLRLSIHGNDLEQSYYTVEPFGCRHERIQLTQNEFPVFFQLFRHWLRFWLHPSNWIPIKRQNSLTFGSQWQFLCGTLGHELAPKEWKLQRITCQLSIYTTRSNLAMDLLERMIGKHTPQ